MLSWHFGSIYQSLTQKVAGSNILFLNIIFFVTEFAKVSENIKRKLKYIFITHPEKQTMSTLIGEQ